VFSGYNPDEWVLKNNYQNRTILEVVNLWVDTNKHLNYLIQSLPVTMLGRRTTDHNFHQICMNLLIAGEPTNLSYLIWDYIFHIEYHLAQIIPDYKKLNPVFQDL